MTAAVGKINESGARAGATLGIVPLKLLALDTQSETLEATPAGNRTVLLEFASEEDFRTWYGSPEYQAVVGKRLASTEGFGGLVHGM